jgi:hypothetical protein
MTAEVNNGAEKLNFNCTKESKEIYQVMKDFEVVPYSEIEKRLDDATQKTIRLVKEIEKS